MYSSRYDPCFYSTDLVMDSSTSNKLDVKAQPNSAATKANKIPLVQTTILNVKNKLLCDLTRAIQLIQKSFLEKENGIEPMSNSDFQVHELCQQFDFLFFYGLKKPEDGYWKVVLEFTHRNVIVELSRLLNVTTNFGKGRAWIYHALNDNLMESYLKCFLENKKSVYRFYKKEESLMADEQDVPYLDHSCWPPHLNVKRRFVDSILNASPESLSQLIGSTMSEPSLLNSVTAVMSSAKQTAITRRSNRKQAANNVLLDNSTTSSTNNLSDLNMNEANDESSETSGRFTATNTMQSASPTFSQDLRSSFTESAEHEPKIDSAKFVEHLNAKFSDRRDVLKKPAPQFERNYESADDNDDEKEDGKQQAEIENEINRLRKENSLLIINNKTKSKPMRKSKSIATTKAVLNLSPSSSSPQDLAASSLKASNYFDAKIEHLENYSTIIENATLKMDACVKDMTTVYQNYGELYNESPANYLFNDESNSSRAEEAQEARVESSAKEKLEDASVYDMEKAEENKAEEPVDPMQTAERVNQSETGSIKSNMTDSVFTDQISQKSLFSELSTEKSDENNSFLTDNNSTELKLEIKLDYNAKLMLMIEVFQNGQNEKLIKFFHATRGHSQGEVENIFLLLSSHGLYILLKNELSPNAETTKSKKSMYKKESFTSLNQIDYVEVSLASQAVHLVCLNKRHSFWISTACRSLTECFLENLQNARQSQKSGKSNLSVFREATQQKLALTKFIANQENKDNQEIKIVGYSLVYWEDQASAVSHLIHKEGSLVYLFKTSGSSEWKKAYFVLRNDVLTQYKSANDRRPTQILKLNGEDFSGCRKSTSSSRPNTIELILSDSSTLYLSAKSETEASDWLQSFCKIISLGNFEADVPAHLCLPCCSVITNNKVYFCHEDLITGFYRLLEAIKLEEITRISFDAEHPFFCILHADNEERQKSQYWFVYFVDEVERNAYIKSLKESWESIFQVALCVEKCKSSEMRKRCIRGVNLIHKQWESFEN